MGFHQMQKDPLTQRPPGGLNNPPEELLGNSFSPINQINEKEISDRDWKIRLELLESENNRLSVELEKTQIDSLRQNKQNHQMIEVLIKLCKQTPIFIAQLENIIKQTEAAALGIGENVNGIFEAAEHHSHNIRHLAISYSGKSDESDNEILVGIDNMAKAIEAFDSRTIYNQKLEEAVRNLVDSSEKVKTLVNEIDDIADLTNMLAINAAIEATHAGQAGASFAVVAQEVRKLSGQSSQTGKNISSLATAIEHDLTLLRQNLTNAVKNDQEEIRKGREVIVTIRERINQNMEDTTKRLHMVQQDDQNIRDQVSKTVVSLQFQDITKQEIEHVIEPLKDMQEQTKNVLVDYDLLMQKFVTDTLKNQYTIEIERQIHQLVSNGKNTSEITKNLDRSFREGIQVNHEKDDLGDNVTLF